MSATALIGQAPTNLGPLTTIFTPPAECTVAVGAGRGGLLGNLFGGGDDWSTAYLGQACSRNRAIDNTACWPTTTAGAESKEAPLSGWGFYSPGLHCPGGYATACMATGGSNGGSEWPVQFRLLAGETAAGCCPSGYACANVNGQTCIQVVTSSAIPTATCDGTKRDNFGFQTVPDVEASITAVSLFAPMIQINWQSSDRPVTTTSSTSDMGPTASSTRTTTSNPLASASGTKVIDMDDESTEETLVLDSSSEATGPGRVPTGTLDAPGSSSDAADASSSETTGLSSNVKVGLGVVGASVVLLACVIGLFWCWRRKKNAEEEQELDRLYGQKTATGSTSDLTSQEIPGWYRGQRMATPANKEPFFRESLREMRMPAEPHQQGGSPYFRDPGYRV
ncbi:hypothetical protein QBC40DRAFT_34570 [Triangularia verruculosa]|uniref:Uncharacterized protein n=1 Tax=Triangularia verruculosa TaxID=2587418 RepID=A0AAN6XM80_9PEZI|nr:hypothetical protein QBC40DRAFT_34570 [Triangularia verruculosa]